MAVRLPDILLTDHSDQEHPLDLTALTDIAIQALALVSKETMEGSVLNALAEIEITLVNDPTIARIHGDFMNLPDPTDVITFHHGEILISIDTAKRQAADYERSWFHEVALYTVHGLLHLAGYEDKAPDDFRRMAETQERILQRCLAERTLDKL